MIKRTVRNGGVVAVNGRRYRHESLRNLVGNIVRVRGDIEFPGMATVSGQDGKMICIAEEAWRGKSREALPPVVEVPFAVWGKERQCPAYIREHS